MSDSPLVFDVTTEGFQDQVVERSRATPVLVDFWAEWCAPCKSLMPVLQKLAEAYGGAFVVAKVNADQEQALVERVGVRSLPTVLLVVGGQVVDHFQGALPESQIRALLDRHVQARPQSPLDQAAEALAAGDADGARAVLEQALADQPEDVALLAELAAVRAAQGELDAAREILGRLPEEAADDRVRSARARLAFAERGVDLGPAEALEARLQADPADSEAAFQLAVQAVVRGDHERALELLMGLARRDRAYGEDAARKALLELFDLLGSEDPRVKEYRRRLFTLLY